MEIGVDGNGGLGRKALEVRESSDDGLFVHDIVGARNNKRAWFPVWPSRFWKVDFAPKLINQRTVFQIRFQLVQRNRAGSNPRRVFGNEAPNPK